MFISIKKTIFYRAFSGLKKGKRNTADGRKETHYLWEKLRANGQTATIAARMEVRGSRRKGGCKSVVEGKRSIGEGSQRRSLSSSCMVFLMRRSIVVSHWSSREMVSNSFTWEMSRKYYQNYPNGSRKECYAMSSYVGKCLT